MPTSKAIRQKTNSQWLKTKSAFTLIELLIVISIIGLLAALTLASYSGAQAKARDGIRKSDLAQIKRALELVKADCYGNAWYPNLTDGQIQTGSTLTVYLAQTTGNEYMNPVPKDPTNSTPQIYAYTPDSLNVSTGTQPCPSSTGVANSVQGTRNYTLSTKLERTNDSAGPNSRDSCNGKPGVQPLASYTPGNYYVCNN